MQVRVHTSYNVKSITNKFRILEVRFATNRDFAEVLEAVRGPSAQVVVVTSPERAAAVNVEQPGFFDNIIKVV